MILLLGASGYMGQAFTQALRESGRSFKSLARKEVDYTRFEVLLAYLRATAPEFLINAAGYTGKPNVDACENAKADTLAGNTLLPQAIAHACLATGTPWGHVSSGCIYSGAKVKRGDSVAIEKDLSTPDLKSLAMESPAALQGYTE